MHFQNRFMRKILLVIVFVICSHHINAQESSENLFYMTDSRESFESFINNLDQISIICPQTFLISRNGVLSGTVDRRVLDTAHHHGIKVVPLIVNSGFNSQLLHAILYNQQARKRSIVMMISLAKKLKLDGWQFDFHCSDSRRRNRTVIAAPAAEMRSRRSRTKCRRQG